MKGATMLATLQKLGVAASFSRPGVSDVTDQRRRVALAGSMCLVSFSASGA
jgi:hypothetical protein